MALATWHGSLFPQQHMMTCRFLKCLSMGLLLRPRTGHSRVSHREQPVCEIMRGANAQLFRGCMPESSCSGIPPATRGALLPRCMSTTAQYQESEREQV